MTTKTKPKPKPKQIKEPDACSDWPKDEIDYYLGGDTTGECLKNRRWRLNNLYHIEDKHGNVIKFKMNSAQTKLLDNLHYLNLILKARQLGFSTFILIFALDSCVFRPNFNAGLVADTLDNAKNLLKRVKFAYERLPTKLRTFVALTADNAQSMEFGNGSAITAGVSLRSGTFNFLHVSEYGKICAKQPDKAKEIKSGSLNTLAQGQLGFIESTAEGRGGDFYEKTEIAQKITQEGRKHAPMEWKFHFYPWFDDPSYTLDVEGFYLNDSEAKYFRDLEKAEGIKLADGQMRWYAAKQREQGDDMWKEFPSTPEEAFLAAKDGAYFAKQIKNLRLLKMIKPIPFDPQYPVNTFWDLGVDDSTSIWGHQVIAGVHRFCFYYENAGEGISHYVDWINEWMKARSGVQGDHYGPHDVAKRMQGWGAAESIQTIAAKMGFHFRMVERTTDKLNTIQTLRTKLPTCEFDSIQCDKGIKCLENYSREWDEKYSVWKSNPRHDEYSHGTDAMFTFSDGFRASVSPNATKPQVILGHTISKQAVTHTSHARPQVIRGHQSSKY